MSIKNDISNLVQEGIINRETGDKIRRYYSIKKQDAPYRMFIVFGVLGSVLIGLGIILILAHNWDNLSRSAKTIIALMPLILGQLFCAFALFRKQDSIAWRESSSVFLFIAIAASISLISQIYNIEGSMSSFVLTWMLCSLPMVYIMRSSVVSLFYIIGITYYGVETQYWMRPRPDINLYWILLLGVLPHHYLLYNSKTEHNYFVAHNWIIPLSVIIMLGAFAKEVEEVIVLTYVSLFGFIYLIGNTSYFKDQPLRNNSFKILGSLGSVFVLLVLSFNFYWEALRELAQDYSSVFTSVEFIIAGCFIAAASYLFYRQGQVQNLPNTKPITPVFILFPVLFFIGMHSGLSVLLINLLIFGIGVLTIREGANKNHLGILNYGLMIITVLIICRFFDINLSFVFRGILFMIIGIGFFALNYWMLKNRKQNE